MFAGGMLYLMVLRFDSSWRWYNAVTVSYFLLSNTYFKDQGWWWGFKISDLCSLSVSAIANRLPAWLVWGLCMAKKKTWEMAEYRDLLTPSLTMSRIIHMYSKAQTRTRIALKFSVPRAQTASRYDPEAFSSSLVEHSVLALMGCIDPAAGFIEIYILLPTQPGSDHSIQTASA